ncbi:MAG TPA: hypothetical protein VME19_19935 [Streptosporangiaceae bacterium]|nr:hypothetical protein [Streptosporangiaceae bacterium]
MSTWTDLDNSFHVESHASLLPETTHAEVSPRVLDAIVVPTIRPQSLQAAATLADDIGCSLVVLCSTPGQARQALAECKPRADNTCVTWVPQSVENNWLSFLTTVHPENEIERSCHADIARKRNIGLLLARMCGWRTIMYLDDDIRDVTAGAVSQAAALTSRFWTASFEIGDYPDNSVVCHAHRLIGGNQGTFPGGSALVVDVKRCDTLFPPIYNEDWLFLFDAVRNRSATTAGPGSQLEYQPFAHSRRAASEEFGDVVAEGLYRLLHHGADVTDATHSYWQAVLDWRFQLIDYVAAQLLLRDGPVVGGALMSLAAARKRLTAISPLACSSFIHAWRTDIGTWRETLFDLPVLGDLADAAKFIGLPARTGCEQ